MARGSTSASHCLRLLSGEGTAFTRDWPGPSGRACGLIEGAAMALNVTALELLWSLDLAGYLPHRDA